MWEKKGPIGILLGSFRTERMSGAAKLVLMAVVSVATGRFVYDEIGQVCNLPSYSTLPVSKASHCEDKCADDQNCAAFGVQGVLRDGVVQGSLECNLHASFNAEITRASGPCRTGKHWDHDCQAEVAATIGSPLDKKACCCYGRREQGRRANYPPLPPPMQPPTDYTLDAIVLAAVVGVLTLAGSGYLYVLRGRWRRSAQAEAAAAQQARLEQLTVLESLTTTRAWAPGTAGEDECALCMAPYAHGDELRVLPCAHVYHKSCVDTWLLAAPANKPRGCPTCRAAVLPASKRLEPGREAPAAATTPETSPGNSRSASARPAVGPAPPSTELQPPTDSSATTVSPLPSPPSTRQRSPVGMRVV